MAQLSKYMNIIRYEYISGYVRHGYCYLMLTHTQKLNELFVFAVLNSK